MPKKRTTNGRLLPTATECRMAMRDPEVRSMAAYYDEEARVRRVKKHRHDYVLENLLKLRGIK